MANVGRLSAQLDLKTGRFSKGIKKSRGDLKKFSKDVRVTRISLKSLAGPLAGFFAVATIRRASMAIKSLMDDMDALAKTSAKLGVAPEQLTGLRLAAQLTGLEVRQLDLGIQRMGRRVAEAAIDTGEAKDAIKQLGLNAKSLNKLNIAEQFFVVADAMGKVTNANNRLRLAFKLFDSEGVALVNTLSLGAQGLEEVFQKAKRLGLAVSAGDLKKIEFANDQFTLLANTIKGFFRQLLVQFAPLMGGLAKMLGDFLAKGKDIPKMLFDGFVKGATMVDEFVHKWRIGFKSMRITVVDFAAGLVNTFRKINESITDSLLEMLSAYAKILKGKGPLQKLISKAIGVDSDALAGQIGKAMSAIAKGGLKTDKKLKVTVERMRTAAADMREELARFMEGGPMMPLLKMIKRFEDMARNAGGSGFSGFTGGEPGASTQIERGQFKAGKAALTAFGGLSNKLSLGESKMLEATTDPVDGLPGIASAIRGQTGLFGAG